MATKKGTGAKSKKSAKKGSTGKGKKARKGVAKGGNKKGRVRPPSPSSPATPEEPIIIPPLYGDEGMRGW